MMVYKYVALVLLDMGQVGQSKGNVEKVIYRLNQFLEFCNQYQIYELKMVGYKMMCEQLRKGLFFERAVWYGIKLMKNAWYFGSNEFETDSYYEISKCLYYRNELELSRFFYERAWRKIIESKKSPIRNLGSLDVTKQINDWSANKNKNLGETEYEEFDLRQMYKNEFSVKKSEEDKKENQNQIKSN
jgi:hypothetical protein